MPAWSRGVVVDITMDRAQWGRFTDFGVTLFDSLGQQLGKQPLNYAFGRLQVELPEGHGDMPVTLGLFPGFADSAGDQRWSLRASIRVYADTSVVLARADSPARVTHRAARERRRADFVLPASPWPLGPSSFRWGCWWRARTTAQLDPRGRPRARRPGARAVSANGRTVRIAAGQGFWGDWLEAPVRQVRGGPIDYLMMDYLAEVTMSIMQKQKSRDPSAGYARDFVPLMERILPDVVERGIRVTSNAGGVNPRGCAEAVLAVARRLDLPRQAPGRAGHGRRHPGPARRSHRARARAQRHGDRPAAHRHPRPGALRQRLPGHGADRRGPARPRRRGRDRTGHRHRASRSGPIFHEFGWSPDDWDKVAAGTVAGHIIECGAQASGGNLLKGWRGVKGLANPGFPIAEASPDGSFVDHQAPGDRRGRVGRLGDRAAGLRDGRPAQLHHARTAWPTSPRSSSGRRGSDRVHVSGIRGGPRTPMLKVSIAYFCGYKAVGTLVYAWPEAYDKAQAADRGPAPAPRPISVSSSTRSSPSTSASTPRTAG